MSERNGGAAFPVNTGNIDNAGSYPPETGMSLRDYFAAKAIPEAMRQADSVSMMSKDVRGNAARIAYEIADAMLKAREA